MRSLQFWFRPSVPVRLSMADVSAIHPAAVLQAALAFRLGFGEVVFFVRLVTRFQLALHGDVRDGELLGKAPPNLRKDASLCVPTWRIRQVYGQADLAARDSPDVQVMDARHPREGE